MVKAGMKQAAVSKQFYVSVRSVRNMSVLSPHRGIPGVVENTWPTTGARTGFGGTLG